MSDKRKKLEQLYNKLYKLSRDHMETLQKFDAIAQEIWGEDALAKEYDDDRGLTAVIMYGEARKEFKTFCKRMDGGE